MAMQDVVFIVLKLIIESPKGFEQLSLVIVILAFEIYNKKILDMFQNVAEIDYVCEEFLSIILDHSNL